MDQSTEAEAVLEQTTDALTCLSLSHEHKKLDRPRTDKSEETNFGNLPWELQEDIWNRALVDNKTLAACKCVSRGWFGFCQRVTVTVGGFCSTHHGIVEYFMDEDDNFYPSSWYEHREAQCFRLSDSNVSVVFETIGRKHRGGLSLRLRDEHGNPCSYNQWLTAYGNSPVPEGIAARKYFCTTCKSRLSVKALGIEALFQTNGRKHQGEVKIVVGAGNVL